MAGGEHFRVSSEPAVVQNGEIEAWREPILRQLAGILASPAFRKSRRYCALLKYLVERTLAGQAEELKERSIGVDVFDRQANYDTTTDHVVRSAGGEIRKRLAQYYVEFGSAAEVRIDLFPGSYIPQFRWRGEEPDAAANGTPLEPQRSLPAVMEPETRDWRRWLILLAAFSACIVLTVTTTVMLSHRPLTALDRFWAPMISPGGPVLLCVGNYQLAVTRLLPGADGQAQKLPIVAQDAIALARIAGTLQAAGKDFRVLPEESTSFDDIRQGTLVLIGARNNPWALRLIGTLRYRFEAGTTGSEPYISDSQNPSHGGWRSIRDSGSSACCRDYAIVARCWNPETSQMVVVAAGTYPLGTMAAGEFLTKPAYLAKLESLAPKGGDRKNVQVVLSTDVIKGVTGPPKIEAAYFW